MEGIEDLKSKLIQKQDSNGNYIVARSVINKAKNVSDLIGILNNRQTELSEYYGLTDEKIDELIDELTLLLPPPPQK